MSKRAVNPWSWQDQFGFSQAWRVDNPGAVIEVSGQTPTTPEGEVAHENDFVAQARLTFENLETVLQEAGASLDDVIKLGAYITDRDQVISYSQVQGEFFPDQNPAQSLLIVKDLALPGLLLEVEATAVLTE